MAQTYRVLAALLSYPTAELRDNANAMAAILEEEALLEVEHQAALSTFLHEIAETDLYEIEERYVGLFDRGRSLSLHLFEHVHGEGRDRGQAMVDLLSLYEEHGLDVVPGELPDFLPLFLEFLSLLAVAAAQALLAEPAAILRELTERLARRDAGYGVVMAAVAALAQAPRTGASAIPDEDPDDLAALDAAWEETAVRFGPGESIDGCSSDRLRTRLRAAQRDMGRGDALGA
ncbi:MAG: nitrate reductase molybdenum cofactor assembly chaperone [Rhodospirillales bacterium]|nr:nitrate reductase molybdenum cofactor assembly chaperone [Rhodospirillales bacterium]